MAEIEVVMIVGVGLEHRLREGGGEIEAELAHERGGSIDDGAVGGGELHGYTSTAPAAGDLAEPRNERAWGGVRAGH